MSGFFYFWTLFHVFPVLPCTFYYHFHFSPCYRLKYWIGSDPPLCFRVLKKFKISVAQLALLSWSFWRMEKMAMSRYSYIFMAVMTYWVRCAWLKGLLNVLMSLSPVMWLRQMTHLLPDTFITHVCTSPDIKMCHCPIVLKSLVTVPTSSFPQYL